jgi:ribonuclease HI
MTQQEFVIYTDGGCRENPGPALGLRVALRNTATGKHGVPAPTHEQQNGTQSVINALLSEGTAGRARALRGKIGGAARLGKRRYSYIHRSMYVKKGIRVITMEKARVENAAKKPVMTQDSGRSSMPLHRTWALFEGVEGHGGIPTMSAAIVSWDWQPKGEQP